MKVVITKTTTEPAIATLCERVELNTVNGGWIDCYGLLDSSESVSFNLNVVQAIYEVKR